MQWTEWLDQTKRMVDAWQGGQLLAGGGTSRLCWATGMDPGKATGLAHVVYLVPPASEVAPNGNASLLGYAVDQWSKIVAKLRVQNVPGGLMQTYDATGVIVLSYFSEFLVGDENAMVRKAVARVREMGSCWTGDAEWDALGSPWCGLGGISVERFKVLRVDKSEDYVSPLRVRSAFSYAVEDEFGVRISGNWPADALTAFGPIQFKRLGMWVSGPDHVRDALSHALFEIRKTN